MRLTNLEVTQDGSWVIVSGLAPARFSGGYEPYRFGLKLESAFEAELIKNVVQTLIDRVVSVELGRENG